MKIISFGKSDTGKARNNNEDSYLVDDSRRIYAVADGIGGHEGGEVASRIAVDTLDETFRGLLPSRLSATSVTDDPKFFALIDAFTLANSKIRLYAARTAVLHGMGTTMTALFLWNQTAYLAHVGDSRAYRLRAGALTQVTADHTVVAEQVRAGQITTAQAQTSPYRHVITRALGIEPEILVERRKITVGRDDTFLLCTDGLTEMVEDGEIIRVLESYSPEAAVDLFIALANDHGGVDNITAVVVKIGDAP